MSVMKRQKISFISSKLFCVPEVRINISPRFQYISLSSYDKIPNCFWKIYAGEFGGTFAEIVPIVNPAVTNSSCSRFCAGPTWSGRQ